MKSPLALLLLICGLALAGCGPQAAPRPPCPKGMLCLEYGNTGEPESLDPHKVGTEWEINVINDLLVSLTDTDPAGRTIPGMATHWEVSDDALTWTFHLRDAKWSDGVPVTADDFVFGLQRLMDPKTAAEQASQVYPIKNSRAVNGGKLPVSDLGVRAVDPHTLEIKLEHPWPVLPDYAAGIGGVFMSPAPRHVVERWGDAWVQPQHFVGNGAYILTSWKLGDRITVRKNPLFYGAKDVCIDRISYYPTNDAVSAERRVKRGELDLNTHIQSNRISFLRQPDQMPAYVHTHSDVGLYYMEFNIHDVPAFRDVRVRQALGMAIDRDFITDKLVRGGQKPAYSLVPPGMVDYSGGAETYWAKWPLAKRQAEARRLLAEAGYGPSRPLKFEIKHRNTADPMLIMPAVQADWKAIGVLAGLAANEVQIAYAAYNAGDFEVADAGWSGGADAMGFLYLHRADAGTQNYGRYNNPRFDALLDAANQERDTIKRQDFLRRAEQMLLDDMPAVPLYYLAKSGLVTPQLTGWTDNQFSTHKSRYFCFKDAAARRAAATGR